MTDIQLKDAQLLSRFLKLAVNAGVKSAVQIHIDRGDNLNARDEKGLTVLMLAAARNRVEICNLLLAAGADAFLLDPNGRSALDFAHDAGAREAASVIHAACMLPTVECAGVAAGEPRQAATAQGSANGATEPDESYDAASTLEADSLGIEPVAIDHDSGFESNGWEAEEEPVAPDDDPTVAAHSRGIQSAIAEHRPIDTSVDWDDFEAILPDFATQLPRADNAEARERLRLIVLRALREGSVPLLAIEDLTRTDDGDTDLEAWALLRMVINDFGAEVDERFEYATHHESYEVYVVPDEKPGEEETVADVMAFIDDLAARRNEPMRIYLREIQRETLLTAETEVSLSQAMERGIEKALDVLAAWPAGVAATLCTVRQVTEGLRPLRTMSTGPHLEVPLAESPLSPETQVSFNTVAALEPRDAMVEAEEVDEESNSEARLESLEYDDELAKFRANAALLSGLYVPVTQDAPAWRTCRDALASLGLSRGFLLELADAVQFGEAGPAHAFAQAMQAYRQARDQMTAANLKLVYSIAKKYQFSGQPLDDLVQEGNIGLMSAVDRYDWRRGFKFSTYATWWIRQHVGRFLADKSKIIRLPVHVYVKTQRVAQARHVLELRHGQQPTIEEVATLVESSVEKVQALSRVGLEPLPLHEVPDIDDCIAVDAKERFVVRDPMECIADIQLSESIATLLGTLNRKEENIVRMRFGVGVKEPMTLEEIGALLGVTRERIRQIEAKGLKRLQHPARLAPFKAELGIAQNAKSEQRCEPTSVDINKADSGDKPREAASEAGIVIEGNLAGN